ncbi:hypothetical protein Tco_0672567 [Tanacetum coccineum]
MTDSLILRGTMCAHTDWVTAITAPSTTPTPSSPLLEINPSSPGNSLKKTKPKIELGSLPKSMEYVVIALETSSPHTAFNLWYWAHLEPILVRNPDTDDPKYVKLRCNLCESVFSASNLSRTTSVHLKKGTCPNFNYLLKPSSSSSSLPPLSSPSAHHTNRKRFAPIGTLNEGPLAMLEDNVKKLKSPKPLPPGPHLTKTQIDSALSLLTDSFYESYGSVSFPSLDIPSSKLL